MLIHLLMAAEAAVPKPPGDSFSRWVTDPRHTVLIVLVLAVVIGGGRKWLEARRAGWLKERLRGPGPAEDEILEASKHGRDLLPELFSLLDPASDPSRRQAAGRALARLWALDQLVAEEEKALVVRGFRVDWRARRRYPRALGVPIPISVRFGVPFLEGGSGLSPRHLEWSCRISGSERASLEIFSEWEAGRSEMTFELDPRDFPGPGPHRLVFQARVRTAQLTSAWELDLPHMPFSLEFDPALEINALCALPDLERGELVRASVRLVPAPESDEPRFLPVHQALVVRNPPVLEVSPRPNDLAHRVEVEFEGIEAKLSSGFLIAPAGEAARTVPLRFDSALPADQTAQPGEYRLRVRLSPDPERGWADPDVRSLWPGPLETEWVPVRMVRT